MVSSGYQATEGKCDAPVSVTAGTIRELGRTKAKPKKQSSIITGAQILQVTPILALLISAQNRQVE
jgi:hypothetical protein